MNAVNAKAEEESQKRYDEYLTKQKAEEEERNTIRCPRCGSTQITTGQTLQRALFGLMYNQITVNRCANCWCTWRQGI